MSVRPWRLHLNHYVCFIAKYRKRRLLRASASNWNKHLLSPTYSTHSPSLWPLTSFRIWSLLSFAGRKPLVVVWCGTVSPSIPLRFAPFPRLQITQSLVTFAKEQASTWELGLNTPSTPPPLFYSLGVFYLCYSCHGLMIVSGKSKPRIATRMFSVILAYVGFVLSPCQACLLWIQNHVFQVFEAFSDSIQNFLFFFYLLRRITFGLVNPINRCQLARLSTLALHRLVKLALSV